MKQTARLALSEFDQLVTSFSYCYDNELRPWCGSATTPAIHSALGPTLKHVHTPLQQFVSVRMHFLAYSVFFQFFYCVVV